MWLTPNNHPYSGIDIFLAPFKWSEHMITFSLSLSGFHRFHSHFLPFIWVNADVSEGIFIEY